MNHNKNEYRYSLKVYHRAVEKPDCPACGRKHRFSEYIDVRTGLPVGPGVGKCDRENHCQYHLSPKEYFVQHPEARQGNHALTMPVIRPTAEKPRLFLPDNVLELYSTPFMQSNFGRWLASKAPSAEALGKVAELFRLTATQTQGIIFWYIDEHDRFCQGKMMWYKENGHRDGHVYTVSSDMAKRGLMPKNADMQRCLFGAQQLTSRPDDVIFIVESEKTAIVMSMLEPKYLWLATGGSSMLNASVVRPLTGRRVVLVPDSGCLTKWQKIMQQTSGTNYNFYMDLENYPSNTDLLDVLYPNE